MAKKIGKRDKEGVGISLERIIQSALRKVDALFGFAVDLEKEDKSEYRQYGQVEGKTASGKDIKGVYGVRVKIGLNPEEFSARGLPRPSRRGGLDASQGGRIRLGRKGTKKIIGGISK